MEHSTLLEGYFGGHCPALDVIRDTYAAGREQYGRTSCRGAAIKNAWRGG
jgi:hypothetical protein